MTAQTYLLHDSSTNFAQSFLFVDLLIIKCLFSLRAQIVKTRFTSTLLAKVNPLHKFIPSLQVDTNGISICEGSTIFFQVFAKNNKAGGRQAGIVAVMFWTLITLSASGSPPSNVSSSSMSLSKSPHSILSSYSSLSTKSSLLMAVVSSTQSSSSSSSSSQA